LSQAARYVKSYEGRRNGISPQEIIVSFMDSVRDPLTRAEIARANISKRVGRKLMPLEKLVKE